MKKVMCGSVMIALLLLSNTAMADYVDPPDWSDNPYYTHQSWDFLTSAGEFDEDTGEFKVPQEPDDQLPWVNPYGAPYLTHTNSVPPKDHAWQWTDYGMGMYDPDGCGCYGGMGSGYVQFEIPNAEEVDLVKELWLQYVLYLPRGGLGPDGAAVADIWTDGDETATQVSKEWEKVYENNSGSGYSGWWWRVTEQWEIEPQPGREYVQIFADATGGPAVLIDEVDVDTRCVPEPASLVLLGTGLVGLFGINRRKKLRG